MIHKAVYYKLKNDAPIAALVGARIYPERAIQNGTMPYIVFSRITSSPRLLHHTGVVPGVESTFQIDCWSKTPQQALTISEAVVNAINGWKGTVENVKIYYARIIGQSDAYDFETGDYAVPVDVEIFHRED